MVIKKNTFTTPLSSVDVLSQVNGLIVTRSKLLFFSFNDYRGKIKDNSFSVRHNNDPLGVGTPRVEGVVTGGETTSVVLKLIVPNLVVGFFGLFILMSVYLAVVSSQIRVNSVTRAPEFSDRLLMAAGGIFIPALVFATTTLIPAFRIHERVAEALQLNDQKKSDVKVAKK